MRAEATGSPRAGRAALNILDQITASILTLQERKGEAFLALKKGLGYCWSVATVAYPDAGKPLMEKWLAGADRDILWIMRENLKKNRLQKMDADWVQRRLAQGRPLIAESYSLEEIAIHVQPS